MANLQEHGPEAAKPKAPASAPAFGRFAAGLLLTLGIFSALAAFLAWRTRDAMANLPFALAEKRGGAEQKTLVDQTPWKTVQALAALAVTQEELGYSREAERLADHDVDQAFAAALRKATLQLKTLSGDVIRVQQRVTELEASVAMDKDTVKNLTAKGGDELEIAQAQLGLDQDELDDAREDLARAAGDQRGAIQQELAARQASMKKFDSAQQTAEVAVVSVRHYRTLAGLIGAWQRQNERHGLLLSAQATSQQAAQEFHAQHDKLEAAAKAESLALSDPAASLVAGIKRSSLERQLTSIYNDRAETETQLAEVYGKWAAQVALQHRIVEHLILIQAIWIAVILVLAILIDALVRHLTGRESLDARRMRTLSRIFRLVVQALALLCILLVIFGPPNQLSTVIGLATAGLTVALQDFILAFVGWFFLMGRNGIGVGDAVEIDGVVGEVDEIGLFRTTLLETGNWTANGHPTGRRVAFNNRYAISGKYFNFTTSGQWMWDELKVTAPPDEDVHAIVERVHAAIVEATKEDAAQAEREWQRASKAYSLAQFSADPAVNLRPSGGGVDLVIRYVTRAGGRFERRNTLYQLVLDTIRSQKTQQDSESAKPA